MLAGSNRRLKSDSEVSPPPSPPPRWNDVAPRDRAHSAAARKQRWEAPTARAVTVRQVERERWSASELAHAVPPGHAVLSLTTVTGEHAPPLLVELG